eukprot:9868277-Alexandrium_andersonii.AAC.1
MAGASSPAMTCAGWQVLPVGSPACFRSCGPSSCSCGRLCAGQGRQSSPSARGSCTASRWRSRPASLR